MRSIGMRKVMGYGAFALAFALLLFAWMKWRPSAQIQKHVGATVAQLPLSFEVNRGQAAADAKFVARGAGYALMLTGRGEPALVLYSQTYQISNSHPQIRPQASRASDLREPAEQILLRLEFPGGNSAPHFEAEQPLPGRSNYLHGNDPSKWLVDVPHYAQARYREVYPGVDVLYYVKDNQLEYDLIVRPGTNPDSIRIKVKGADGIEQSERGGLVLQTAADSVLLHKPVAYQQGPNGEREVACNYQLDKDEIRFALGDYDHSKVLRIDPVLSYSARLDAHLKAIAVDALGNSYVAGTTFANHFPTTAGAFQPSSGGNADALIAKLDPTGSSLLFATYLGGDEFDSAEGIALDPSGNVIVTGNTGSKNFPVNGGFQLTLLGNSDAFISKLNANGTQLPYSSYLGGSGYDSAWGVALDSSGRAVLTGVTGSLNFPATPGALQAVYGGGDADAFIAKLDTTKSGVASLLFSTYLGGSGEDVASAIAVDASGFAFLTGFTRSANFPTANAFQAACASCAAPEYDAFVSKLNADGTALAYSTFLGGAARDIGEDIAVDSVGNAYVAGQTSSNNFPVTPAALQTTYHGVADAFVTKLNAAGSAMVYSSFIGGADHDVAAGIAVNTSGDVFLSGFSYSADFPAVSPLQGYGGGLCDDGWGPYPCSDAFVTQINPSGSMLIFSTLLGGGTDDSAARIVVDGAGNIYVTGTAGDAFLSTPGAVQMAGTGFAAKISPATVGVEPTTITLTSSPNPSNQGQSVTFMATVAPQGAIGAVTFRDGNAIIGSASVGGGTATFTTLLPGGSHSITAQYWGDANFAASTSEVLTHVVNNISLTATQTSATVARGGTATFPLTVDQTGVLTSAIAFSCPGLPAGWSCGFNPTTVPAGSGPTQVTLTIQTSSITAQNLPRAPIGYPTLPRSVMASVFALLMVGIHVTGRRGTAHYLRPAVALGFAALLVLAAGCGSTSSQPPQGQKPQPQSFTVDLTVNATSGSTTASVPFTITVR